MSDLQYTLLSDGSSDRALMPVLTWLLHEHIPARAVQAEWADLRRLPNPPRTLRAKIRTTLALYPCDLLFIHRDAENAPPDSRRIEIVEAVNEVRSTTTVPVEIAVIPIRMTEAWLLIDGCAIREAAGNPNGSVRLDLPGLADIEGIPDPKSVLRSLILAATELPARRRNRFNVFCAVQRIPEYVEDFSSLRQLSAFRTLEQEVVDTISEQAWGV